MSLKLSGSALILTLIIGLAFFVRFWNLTSTPPALNWDEVSIGYNAYSILKTGKDEWGELLPLHFKSYGEYKLPAQIYFSIPGIYFFGLTELGVRITPIIYGTLTVLLLFFLVRALFNDQKIALLSAFLLAISPWHVSLTRASFESSFSVFWVVMGIFFLVKGFKDPKWLWLSMLPFVISVYTYNSARVFTPIFLAAILLIYKKDLFQYKKQLIIAVVIFFVFMMPLVSFFLSGGALARYKLVSITNEAGLIPRIEEARNNSNLWVPLNNLINNKYSYLGTYFLTNYFAHLSPQFLFFNGAGHKQHHVQDLGELYLFQAPFLIIGLIWLLNSKIKFRYLLFAWLLIAFIPVSTTYDSIPNALRTVIAAPVFQIISAFGIVRTFSFISNKKFIYMSVLLLSLVVGLSFYNFLNKLFFEYPKEYSRDWQYGYKQAVYFINQNHSNYKNIVLTSEYGQPYMFVLFFTKYDPSKFQNDKDIKREETQDFIQINSFDKYVFIDTKNIDFKNLSRQYPNSLFVLNPENIANDTNLLSKIDFLDGKNAFLILDNK